MRDRVKKLLGIILTMLMVLAACGKKESSNVIVQGMVENIEALNLTNTHDILNVATYITKIEDTYFISDCYHNQIIYNTNIQDELTKWKVLTQDVHYAHTIAYGQGVMLIDDTENNRLMIFQKIDGNFVHTQTIDNIGMKPHFVQYNEEMECFMAWSSITGEMYFLKITDSKEYASKAIKSIYIDKIIKIDELYGVYVRSFTVIDGEFYFVSGHNNGKIIKCTLNQEENRFDIAQRYEVASEIAGMVQISKIQDYYYLTISTDAMENQDFATIIRTKDLALLSVGEYEDVYDSFGVSGGTPYYISQIDKKYYLSHHRTSENILEFEVTDNEITNVKIVY